MKKTMRVVFVILLLISLNIYVVLSPGGISKNSCYSRSLINMGDVTDFTYQRSAAVNYGMYYYNKYYLSDGYNFYDCGAGDCAHFVSCAIGNEQNWRGGGLSLGYRWHDYCKTYYYGVPGSRLPEDDRGWDLVPYLINHHLAKIVSSVDQLSPGDIIQYKWSTTHTHVALYVGNHYIVDHYQGTSPWGYNALYNNDSLYGGSTITFVHIFDNPLLEPDASSYFDVNYLQSGDRVKCLVNGLRVRKGPGVGHSDVYAQDYKIKGSLSAGDLGTVKYGPATLDGKYVWYYIDWDNNLSGWSAQGSGQTARDYIEKISTTPDQPPTARIELRKQGTTTPISTINVNEFFDIYVGGSTDDKGIVRVRFSSDESQDGVPTGSWTNWYDWNSSSGSWNAPAKTEAWLFSTEGIKEVWVEVEDISNQSDKAYADITVANTSKPDLIVEDIRVDPDPPTASSSTRIYFTIKNQGTGNATGTIYSHLYFDGNYKTYSTTNGLAAGSSAGYYWDMTWPSDSNQHAVKVIVDVTNVISESDESNNERTEYFSATTPTLTVNVSGPSSGYTNTNYTFTASASGGTGSYTYSWSSDGLASHSGNSATYNWSTSGTKTVTCTVTSGSETASDSATISISNPTPTLTVNVSGPSSGYTNTNYTFTASASGGTGSYTYSWSSDGLASHSGNSATYNWSTSGTKTVTCTVTSGSETAPDSATISISAPTSLPDLTVDTLYFDPAQPTQGGSITFHFTVHNQGTAPVTADHQIYVYVDGASEATGTDDTHLAAGASQGWYWTTQWPSDSAMHTFTVTVDATNVIAESNESNNSASISASASSSNVSKYIHTTAPNGNDTFAPTDTIHVTWEVNGFTGAEGKIRVLFYNGQTWSIVTGNLNIANGSYDLNLANQTIVDPLRCRIRVGVYVPSSSGSFGGPWYKVGSQQYYDETGHFWIVSSSPSKYIHTTAPNGNDTFTPTDTIHVTWEVNGFTGTEGKIRVLFYNGQTWSIVAGNFNIANGSYDLDLSNQTIVDPLRCRIRVGVYVPSSSGSFGGPWYKVGSQQYYDETGHFWIVSP